MYIITLSHLFFKRYHVSAQKHLNRGLIDLRGDLMYEQLIQSPDVIELYEKIQKLETNDTRLKHGMSHVLNVVKNTEIILRQLNAEEDYIDAAKISALLHDIGSVHGYEDHAFHSYVWASEYFRKHNIILPYHTEVLYAIRDHNDFFESISLMTLVLILADKLDITKERLTQSGKETEGIRQLQYIDSIDVSIEDNILHINLNTSHDLNIGEMIHLNFIQKLRSAIIALSRHQNLTPRLSLNHEILDITLFK